MESDPHYSNLSFYLERTALEPASPDHSCFLDFHPYPWVRYLSLYLGLAQTCFLSVSSRMTRVDLRNYLEQIYNVPVAAVRTRVQHGSNSRRDHKNVRIKKPDYKVAYVQLAHGQTFTFPDLFPEKEPTSPDPLEEELPQQRQSSDPRCPGIPSWFGL